MKKNENQKQGMLLVIRYFICSCFIVVSVELALEFRHYSLGYDTPIFGKKANAELGGQASSISGKEAKKASVYGPVKGFPFKSRVIGIDKSKYRLWVASASHAVGGRISANSIFPNMICDDFYCDVINGSQNGMTIAGNIELLTNYASFNPDAALLYQMSMFIANRASPSSLVVSKEVANPLVDISELIKIFHRFSLYVHLTDLIGNNIELQGQLKDRPRLGLKEEFLVEVNKFVKLCEELGVTPILSTFAISHDATNLSDMSPLEKTNFVKWVQEPYLSPIGWVNTVQTLNEALRGYANKKSIVIVDVAKEMSGQPEFFTDFVHFNELGHKFIANLIREKIEGRF